MYHSVSSLEIEFEQAKFNIKNYHLREEGSSASYVTILENSDFP